MEGVGEFHPTTIVTVPEQPSWVISTETVPVKTPPIHVKVSAGISVTTIPNSPAPGPVPMQSGSGSSQEVTVTVYVLVKEEYWISTDFCSDVLK
jgi:hypothetical protein